jgi:hypothetical protein
MLLLGIINPSLGYGFSPSHTIPVQGLIVRRVDYTVLFLQFVWQEC